MKENLLDRPVEELTDFRELCSCGRNHEVFIRRIILEKEALDKVPSLIRELGLGRKGLLVADTNTYRVAGQRLQQQMLSHGIQVKTSIFHNEELHADEKSLGTVLIDLEEDTDFLVAVGTGTVNDIVRFISYKMDIPYMIVATAPSMDGFASTVSPLMVKGFKKTYGAVSPVAIVGDLQVMAQAPQSLIAAGLGDIMGKVTSQADWILGKVMEGEHYCPVIVEMMMNAVQKCIANVDGLVRRDQQAVKGLMEGLVLSGIAMQMMGNSRPASGAEHHISHYWEMQHFMKGQTSPFHGIKVGVATPLIISMYRKLFSMNKDELHIVERNAADRERWKAEIRRCYGPLADEVIMENEAGFLPSEKTREALNRLKEQWDKVKEETDFFLSAAGDIRKLMMKMEAPSSPEDLGIPPAMLYDALCHAMEVRSRYTILRLADRVGLLDQFAEEITHEMYHNG